MVIPYLMHETLSNREVKQLDHGHTNEYEIQDSNLGLLDFKDDARSNFLIKNFFN